MPAECPNERSAQWRVTAVMNRIRITFVALLPALWLLASGQFLFDSSGNGAATTGGCHSQCVLEGGKHCLSHPPSASDISARGIRSRVGKHSGKSDLICLEPISCSAWPRSAIACFTVHTSSPALATGWQFACRAAPNPRAPSFAS